MDIDKEALNERVIEALRTVFDPEIPVNIYDIGLIYGIEINDDAEVHIKMTLTSPSCPVAGSLPGEVEQRVAETPDVAKATLDLVWDPPWTMEMLSEAAKLQLGLT